MIIKTFKDLIRNCDAIVLSPKKKDHKFIFLKKNKPSNITIDPLRRKGKPYIKNGLRIYDVVVDMYEMKEVISGDKMPADIWVVDSLHQAQIQLDKIISSGAKQFYPKIIINRNKNLLGKIKMLSSSLDVEVKIMKKSYLQILKESQIPKKWRPRVELYIMKGGKILVGHHPEIGIHVPGGGIEPGQNIISASKNEALEEAGVKIKNVKLATKENYYEDWYKLDAEGQPITKKDRMRMKYFRGIKHHYIRADFDGYDDSLLGADNDALSKLKFISKQELIRAYQKQGKKFDPPQYAFRIEVVKKL